MESSAKIFLTLSIFLVLCVTFSGCSDSSGSAAATTPSNTVTTATTTGPLFTAGDIVRTASGSTSSGYLIISYDSATDSYTRALVYENSDGTWGYRVNSNTETSARSVMDKAYTVKITHVTVSSVPVKTPTTVATTSVTTTTTTAVTTTTAAPKPSVKKMDPDEGYIGKSVTTAITGSNFKSAATAMLQHSGETSINATNVVWDSATQLTCTFAIPKDATIGVWDIVVKNPDGQSGKNANYFMVHGNISSS